jgi:hypothetical protein
MGLCGCTGQSSPTAEAEDYRATEPTSVAGAADPTLRVVKDFELKIHTYGKTSQDLIFVYKGNEALLQPTMRIQLYNDNNSRTTLGKSWQSWKPGEEKTVDLPIEYKVLEVHLQGTAYIPLSADRASPRKFQGVFCAGRWWATHGD